MTERIIREKTYHIDEESFGVSLAENINRTHPPTVKIVSKAPGITSRITGESAIIVQDIKTHEVFALLPQDFDTVIFQEGDVNE